MREGLTGILCDVKLNFPLVVVGSWKVYENPPYAHGREGIIRRFMLGIHLVVCATQFSGPPLAPARSRRISNQCFSMGVVPLVQLLGCLW